jgi:hypothetical protein
MAKTLRCRVGWHQWCTVGVAGGGAEACWNCGTHRRTKTGPVHTSTMDRHDAARARDEAFAIRDSQTLWGGGGG